MRRYSPEDEERMHAASMVRDWTQSGLIDAPQRVQLDAGLQVELRRTNPFLRATLAFFTALIIAASVGFVALLLGLTDGDAIAALTAISAAGCVGLAEYLIERFRLYRFGVEESLATASVVLVCISAIRTSSRHTGIRALP